MASNTTSGTRAVSGQSSRFIEGYLRDQTGFRWMYVVDVVALLTAMILITTLRFGPQWPTFTVWEYLIGFGIATAVHIGVAYFGGLYERENRLGSSSRLARVAQLTTIAVLIDAAISLGASKFLMPRLNLAIFAIVATLALTFNRWLAQSLVTARFGRPRVLLVGSPDDIELAESHLDETDRDAIVVGRRSSVDDLAGVVDSVGASDVLLLGGVELHDVYPSPLDYFEVHRVGVYHRLTPADTLLGLKRTRQIAGMPFVAVHTHAMPPSKAHFKRLLDLFYVLVALPLLVPIMLLVMLYTKIVAGGPIFYRQSRVGRYGKPFQIVKIRTMYPGSEDATGPMLAQRDDVRVIPAMAWMRSMRLDELPQVWNVIRGDMSLVGPRPERAEMADGYEMLLPGYGRRHDVRPGITGLAQVNGRYHTDPGFKLGHDLQYLVNWSPIFDMQILLRTIWVVLARRV